VSFLVEIPEHTYIGGAFDDFSSDAEFRLGTARAMMWLSQLAYETRHAQRKIAPVLQRWSLTPVAAIVGDVRNGFPMSSTRGLVATGRGALLVSFAGTDPLALQNWVTNFHLGPRARVTHHGFTAAIAAVWDELAATLTDRRYAQLPLFFTGHSLGGALAIIAAERLLREGGTMATGIYAFGSPRVGGADFADAYAASGLASRTFRLVHGLDIIPAVPPATLGFRHVGRMLACARGACFAADAAFSDGNEPLLAATLASGYRQRLRDVITRNHLASARGGLIGWYQTFVLPPTIVDHLPERYRHACDGAQKITPRPDLSSG
jgi:hypothetical protein